MSKPLNTYPASMNDIIQHPALSLAFTCLFLLPISNHPNPTIIVELELNLIPKMHQMIPTLLTLVLPLPLLAISTSHSTATSTSSATSTTCSVATNLTLPISPPCPGIADMGLRTYLSLRHCCLEQPFNPSAHGLWSRTLEMPRHEVVLREWKEPRLRLHLCAFQPCPAFPGDFQPSEG